MVKNPVLIPRKETASDVHSESLKKTHGTKNSTAASEQNVNQKLIAMGTHVNPSFLGVISPIILREWWKKPSFSIGFWDPKVKTWSLKSHRLQPKCTSILFGLTITIPHRAPNSNSIGPFLDSFSTFRLGYPIKETWARDNERTSCKYEKKIHHGTEHTRHGKIDQQQRNAMKFAKDAKYCKSQEQRHRIKKRNEPQRKPGKRKIIREKTSRTRKIETTTQTP